MKFSIIIPSHDEIKDLEVTVAMAVASDPPPHEVIVVDDCSIVPVADRMGSFPDVKVIRNETQMGAGPAKRIGAEQSVGDVIIIMDSHMRMPLDWLAKIQEAQLLFPDAVMCTVCRGFETTSKFIGCGAEFTRTRDMFLGRRWLKRGPVESYGAAGEKASAPSAASPCGSSNRKAKRPLPCGSRPNSWSPRTTKKAAMARSDSKCSRIVIFSSWVSFWVASRALPLVRHSKYDRPHREVAGLVE